MPKPSIVALIPARAGSKRVPSKNIRLLGSHPLLAWSIATAKESGVFTEVVVSTESDEICEIALVYGASAIMRPDSFATDTSPDIEWIKHALEGERQEDAFAILRPTSPFRTAETIRRAWRFFHNSIGADSLRAVEKCTQHPYKMWSLREQGRRMDPVIPVPRGEHPWHSSQYAALPEIYVQNSSLEMAWTHVLDGNQAQAGENVMPFFTEGHEGLTIDYPRDFEYAELLLERGEVTMPPLLAAERAPETVTAIFKGLRI